MTSFFNVLASDCVIACRRSGHNVIAYEDGVSIFEKVLIQPHDKEGPINLNCNVPNITKSIELSLSWDQS